MKTMQKVTVRYNPNGESGNLFYILGAYQKALKESGEAESFKGIQEKVFASKSYKEALEIIGEKVTLVEDETER